MKNNPRWHPARGRGAIFLIALLAISILTFGVGITESRFNDQEQNTVNTYGAWTSIQWTQTTQSDFEAGVLVDVNTGTYPGSVTLDKQTTPPSIYATTGNSANFFIYNTATDTWETRANTPANVGAGGALAYDGGDYIYALKGAITNNFWRYSISGNTWVSLSTTPDTVDTGGALAYAGGDYIYAFRGSNTTTFWRYSISGNIWNEMALTPKAVDTAGALAYAEGNFIYGLQGFEDSKDNFWRYNISGDAWYSKPPSPTFPDNTNVGPGGALMYDGGNYFYSLRGLTTNAFWRYSISDDSWVTIATTPATVGEGGALAYDGSTYIYAFRGNTNPGFWRYTISSDTWNDSAVSDLSSEINVGWGGSLVYVPSSLGPYYNSGSLASQVKDTEEAGARWDALDWDTPLVDGTGIALEVRASDSIFSKDNTTLSWISVGGTSPVYTGLPTGRYFQWRATLTTSDTAITPVLNEVRAYYT